MASEYEVTFFYLATGMNGNPLSKNYGIVKADSCEEAVNVIMERECDYSSKSDRQFFRGCLTAKLIRSDDQST